MTADLAGIAIRDLAWKPCHRLIPSRYPTVGLYDRIADPADLDVVFAIEALTNPRIRDEIGEIRLVPPDERVSGPGSTPIMAAFTHLNPEGSRFSDGSFGVYYATQDPETAIAEVSHHRAVFLARTGEPPLDIDLRLINATLQAALHDLRPLRRSRPAVYDPADYGAARTVGGALRAAGSWGVLYHSVRHPGGLCAGVFRPKALQRAREAAHIALHWDGQRITHWFEKRPPRALA
ncbi:MAG: RES family NAD+ phosphorylase [Burkholderiales bacterium]|nr:RES family NAD+ phosphorylase [Burkholderiales bacterium]